MKFYKPIKITCCYDNSLRPKSKLEVEFQHVGCLFLNRK